MSCFTLKLGSAMYCGLHPIPFEEPKPTHFIPHSRAQSIRYGTRHKFTQQNIKWNSRSDENVCLAVGPMGHIRRNPLIRAVVDLTMMRMHSSGVCYICCSNALEQRFSTAGPRLGTGPWHQLHRAARGSPGICHFSFLSISSRINIL